MNKPLQSSGPAYRALRAGAVLFALLFVFGVSSAIAQADVVASSTLAGSQSATKPNLPTSSSAAFPSNADAINILRTEVRTLEATTGGTPQVQALNSAKASYYSVVATGVMKGGSIGDIYDTSANDLYSIIADFPTANQPDFATIRQNLFDLLTL